MRTKHTKFWVIDTFRHSGDASLASTVSYLGVIILYYLKPLSGSATCVDDVTRFLIFG